MMLRDSVKSFVNFMASSVYPSTYADKIFKDKSAQNIDEVQNGLSHITDDLTLSRFIVDMSNFYFIGELNATNICNHFLQVYQSSYE